MWKNDILTPDEKSTHPGYLLQSLVISDFIGGVVKSF
jgi:hypothetical protein